MYYKVLDSGAIRSCPEKFDGATELNIDREDVQFLRMIDGKLVVDPITKAEYRAMHSNIAKLVELEGWFEWCDIQVNKAQRASRLRKPFNAIRGEEVYKSLEELDKAAERNYEELIKLKAKAKEASNVKTIHNRR